MGDDFLNCLWKNDMSMNALIDELLEKGVFSQYILCVDKDETQKISAVKALEASYRTFKNDNRQKLMNYYLLAFMLSGKKVLYKNGVEFNSVQELTSYLKCELDRSYDEFEKICHELIDYNDNLDPQFESWLLALGKKKEIEQWRMSLNG